MDLSLPAYLVKGDDQSLVNQALDGLIATLLGPSTAGRGTEQLITEELSQDATVSNVVDVCQTPAFLTDKRIVLVRNVGRFKADEVQPLIDYLASPMPSTSLILVGGGGALPTRLSKAIKDHGHVIDASAPFGKARNSWVMDRVRKGPVRLDGLAVNTLIAHLGDELGQLDGILDALAGAYGQGATVSVDELGPFLGVGGAAAPWELTDAIDSGDVTTALAQLHRMLGAGGRHPLVIMASISRHVGVLLKLDGAEVSNEAEAAALLGIAPYPAKKSLIQSRRLGSAAISRATCLVSDADVDLRGASGWPAEVVLEVLIARLAKLTPMTKSKRPTSSKRAS